MTSRSPKELDLAVADKTGEICARRYAEALRAVVLAGSVARHEATWTPSGAGYRLAGDAEFLVVIKQRAPLPDEQGKRRVEAEIQDELARQGIEARVQLSPVRADFFSKQKPSIFAYELRAWGRAVAGDASTLDLIPAFSAADIPLEDAWRLLANRMIEHLEAAAESESADARLTPKLEYATVKLCLDAATSLAVFGGFYAPSYGERRRQFQGRVERGEADASGPFPLMPFVERLNLATDLKLGRGREREGRIDRTFWHESWNEARLLWLWEVSKLVGQEGVAGRDLMDLWPRRQALAARMRGWMFVARSCGWLSSARWWPRWARLATLGSPRCCVYRVTQPLFEQLPAAFEAGPSRFVVPGGDALAATLPVPGPNPASGAGWRWADLVRQVAWNYHHFLEPTRA